VQFDCWHRNCLRRDAATAAAKENALIPLTAKDIEMRSQTAITGSICLALGSLLGALVSNSVEAQSQPSAPHIPSRYQMSLKAHGGNTTSTTVFVCDTATGQVWYRETLGEVTGWTDMASWQTAAKK
jgi:hypothetical protein